MEETTAIFLFTMPSRPAVHDGVVYDAPIFAQFKHSSEVFQIILNCIYRGGEMFVLFGKGALAIFYIYFKNKIGDTKYKSSTICITN